ncbi:phosphotransferase [Amycolatopsis sp. NPDC003676]
MDLQRRDYERLKRAAGADVVRANLITGRGYTQNRRMIIELASGATLFAKQATDAASAAWLRTEYSAYRHLRGSFLPELLGWDDDGEFPVLLLQDLSDAHWPPPWDAGMVDAVLAVLEEVAAHPVFPGLSPVRETGFVQAPWAEVADDPRPLLGLELCSEQWLEKALPVLLDVAHPDLAAGNALVHLDVRSDNLCFPAGRTVLFDWNLAAVGNPEFDVAFWLPSLRLEGGPRPEEAAAVSPGVAALVAGFFASKAGLPVIPHAPRVRDIQRRQLEVALPWAARALELPPPDGAAAAG